MEVGLVFAWFECLNREFACMMRGHFFMSLYELVQGLSSCRKFRDEGSFFLCLCMSLYRDCLLAVSLEMKSLFLFWSSHGYVCMGV